MEQNLHLKDLKKSARSRNSGCVGGLRKQTLLVPLECSLSLLACVYLQIAVFELVRLDNAKDRKKREKKKSGYRLKRISYDLSNNTTTCTSQSICYCV